MVKLRIAVLVSGRGSDLQSIIDAIGLGMIDGEIVLVLSNKPDAYGLQRAKDNGMDARAVSHGGKKRAVFEQEMIDVIDPYSPDLVVLAGFMRRLTPLFVQHYLGRLINIHPALLPSFPGTHGQRDALNWGVKITGCTVHFVDLDVDQGPIIMQYPVRVMQDDDEDSLASRILGVEHLLLPFCVQLYAQDRLEIQGRKVRIKDFEWEELEDWMNKAREKGIK